MSDIEFVQVIGVFLVIILIAGIAVALRLAWRQACETDKEIERIRKAFNKEFNGKG